MGAYSVTLIYNNRPTSLIQVGDKVRFGKRILSKRFQAKEMIYRLKKKKFAPKLIVTSVDYQPGYTSFNVKPYNF